MVSLTVQSIISTSAPSSIADEECSDIRLDVQSVRNNQQHFTKSGIHFTEAIYILHCLGYITKYMDISIASSIDIVEKTFSFHH